MLGLLPVRVRDGAVLRSLHAGAAGIRVLADHLRAVRDLRIEDRVPSAGRPDDSEARARPRALDRCADDASRGAALAVRRAVVASGALPGLCRLRLGVLGERFVPVGLRYDSGVATNADHDRVPASPRDHDGGREPAGWCGARRRRHHEFGIRDDLPAHDRDAGREPVPAGVDRAERASAAPPDEDAGGSNRLRDSRTSLVRRRRDRVGRA